jgi:hypothetical protein
VHDTVRVVDEIAHGSKTPGNIACGEMLGDGRTIGFTHACSNLYFESVFTSVMTTP